MIKIFGSLLTTVLLLACQRSESAPVQASQQKTTPTTASVYGLVIGIDDYDNLKPLKGAVNDALDMAALLNELGAKKTHVLLNGSASRQAIMTAWQDLTKRAQAGDTVILSYAGHGAQEPEKIAGSEADGKDEVTVLGRFDVGAPHNAERIYDKEWRAMVASAEHLNVIQVFDSCHSGSATRSVARLDATLPSRFEDYGAIEDDMLPAPPVAVAEVGLAANEIYFGGTQDGSLVYEVALNQRPRGALTSYFTRGVRGAADDNQDGVITRGEMAAYIRRHVPQETGARQTPAVLYSSSPDVPLLAVSPGGLAPEEHVVTYGFIGRAPAGMATPRHGLPVQPPAVPELLWDVGRREVLRQGDVVAHLAGAESFGREVERWAAVRKLRDIPVASGFYGRVTTGPRLYARKEQVQIQFDARRYPFLTLLNFGPSGFVNFLFPRRSSYQLCNNVDEPKGTARPAATVTCTFEVVPEFGMEYLVAIASDKPLTGLHATLAQIDGRPAPMAAAKAVATALGDVIGQMTDVSIYTVETLP